MEKPVRILHVIAGMGSGGAESFIMNMYRHMDHSKVQFDFLLRSSENVYEDELKNGGSRIFYTSSFPRHAWKNYQEVRRILKQNDYQIVHVHQNALLYMTAIKLAKKAGVPCRVMHSHSSSMAFKKLLPIHRYYKKRIRKIATQCFACSEQAGKWMFGEQCPYSVIHNAIDIEKFSYDQNAREQIRKSFHIPIDAFVVGHVGRFWKTKNHTFLLHAFSKVLKEKPNAYLFLIGEGGLEENIKDLACELGIEKHVVFAGVRRDVNKAMSAFDVFALPSLYEGLSVVAIEAQANGLPLICSEATPTSVLFSNDSIQVPLSAGIDAWSERLLAAEGHRCDVSEMLRKAGYDIHEEALKLQDFYCKHGS